MFNLESNETLMVDIMEQLAVKQLNVFRTKVTNKQKEWWNLNDV